MPDMMNNEAVPDSWSCCGCIQEYIGDNMLGFTGNNGRVCDDCSRNCPNCENDFNINSGYGHADSDDGPICNRCTRENYRMCYECDEWVHSDNANYDRHDRHICNDCCERSYEWCHTCETYVRHDDDYHNCSDNRINGYDYRPAPIFHHTTEEFDDAKIILKDSRYVMRHYRQIAYLGLEIEVESMGTSLREGCDLFDGHSDVFYLKSDGSICDGFEIVTHPMTLDWAKQNFPYEVLESLEATGFESWHPDSTGTHIHVSRDGFRSESHQGYFINLITRNQRFFEALAGRSGSRWAQFDKGNLKNIGQRIRRQRGTDRYSAVNVQNVPTLEVRIFNGSLNRRRITMSMELVDACVKYTEFMTPKDVISGNSFDWEQFAKWVSAHSDKYTTLNEYIKEFQTTGRIGE